MTKNSKFLGVSEKWGKKAIHGKTLGLWGGYDDQGWEDYLFDTALSYKAVGDEKTADTWLQKYYSHKEGIALRKERDEQKRWKLNLESSIDAVKPITTLGQRSGETWADSLINTADSLTSFRKNILPEDTRRELYNNFRTPIETFGSGIRKTINTGENIYHNVMNIARDKPIASDLPGVMSMTAGEGLAAATSVVGTAYAVNKLSNYACGKVHNNCREDGGFFCKITKGLCNTFNYVDTKNKSAMIPPLPMNFEAYNVSGLDPSYNFQNNPHEFYQENPYLASDDQYMMSGEMDPQYISQNNTINIPASVLQQRKMMQYELPNGQDIRPVVEEASRPVYN
jgi:hypothetical protein